MPSQAIPELLVFDPLRLQTNTIIEYSIREFEAGLEGPDLESLIDCVISQPILLAFLISVSSNNSSISHQLIDDFPLTSRAFIGSISAKVLLTLSGFMTASPCKLPDEITHSLERYPMIVEFAPQALQALHRFIDETRPNGPDHTFIDLQPIYYLGYRIPVTLQDADKICVNILREQGRILERYVSTLRMTEISELVKKMYIPSYIGNNDRSTDHEDTFAYPPVQPMDRMLYFNSPKSFGEWLILLHPDAEGYLRKARKNSTILKIILRKMRDLSKGHFSADNHKRLTGSKTQIPIYEAKLTRDLRLLYHIDYIECDSNSEKQVIKVLGIYTHAKINARSWDSVSNLLHRKDKEHIKRCTFRKRQHKLSNDVFSPASFPQQPDAILPEMQCESPLTDLSQEDLNKIYALVGLGKYVSVSQPLLNSIFADLDVQHVFRVSNREKEIVEHQASCYVLGRSGTGKTTTMLFKMLCIERTWATYPDGSPRPRQLFVTKSPVLSYKVEEHFSKLTKSLDMATMSPEELKILARTMNSSCEEEEEPLVRKQDLFRWQHKLPERFGLLTDDHFPLFVSFDQLCDLLQGDIAAYNNSTKRPYCGIFVSYKVFSKEYWPHFPQPLTKGLDSFLVFSQLLGVIRGSEAALKHHAGFMTREEYENLSGRSHSSFASMRRAEIYTIFESYLKQKRKRGDYDAADRVNTILCNDLPRRRVDYIYVDEAQDNLLVDALILRKLCRNPNGLFWAGDTAQTISAGSSFSFGELKSFLFRIEQKRRHDGFGIPGVRPEEPRMFYLPVNYRSHAGITNCAQAVIEIITKLWPNSIDILGPERGRTGDIKPVFFSRWDQDEAAIERFLFGTSGSSVELGAPQCIIVRDQAAADQLQRRGIKSTIMTLYDCKGLEFNDVLLYNFFRDSATDVSQWRVILNALEEGSTSVPCFDEIRHASVCSELKFLYVAITRARTNLWIVDFSDTCEPMRLFWATRNLIRHCPAEIDLPHLAVTSSTEEWAKQGKVYFDKELYSLATTCFEKASMPEKVKVAKAYHLQQEAGMLASGSNQRKMAFNDAALAFKECAMLKTTVTNQYLWASAECYDSAGDPHPAASLYEEAAVFDLAAQRYCDCGMFNKAVQILEDHKISMNVDVVRDVELRAARFYFEDKDWSRACSLLSHEGALDYAKRHELFEAHVDLLCYMARFADAADLRLSKGQRFKAIELLRRCGSEDSMRRAVQYTLQDLWQDVSLGNNQKAPQRCSRRQQLLDLATTLDSPFWSLNEANELSMFRAIQLDDSLQVQLLREKFLRGYNLEAAVVCFDYLFGDQWKIQAAIRRDFIATLKEFIAYAQILKQLASYRPAKNSVQKLLAFYNSGEKDVYVVRRHTHLHGQLKATDKRILRSDNEGMWVSVRHLQTMIRPTIEGHVRKRVLNVMKEMGSAIVDAEQWSLSAALIFTRSIIQCGLPVEAIVLCNFIDCICGFLAFSICGEDAYVPSSWRTEISQTSGNDGKRDSHLMPLFIASTGDLVQQILSSSAGYIHFDHPNQPSKDGFISRILRALYILGHNIPISNIGLKLEILRLITSLAANLFKYPLSRRCAKTGLSFIMPEVDTRNGVKKSCRLSEEPQTPREVAKIPGSRMIPTTSNLSPVAHGSGDVGEIISQRQTHLGPSRVRVDTNSAAKPLAHSRVASEALPNAESINIQIHAPAKDGIEGKLGIETDKELLGDTGGNEFWSSSNMEWGKKIFVNPQQLFYEGESRGFPTRGDNPSWVPK